jgi:hypothetical protein
VAGLNKKRCVRSREDASARLPGLVESSRVLLFWSLAQEQGRCRRHRHQQTPDIQTWRNKARRPILECGGLKSDQMTGLSTWPMVSRGAFRPRLTLFHCMDNFPVRTTPKIKDCVSSSTWLLHDAGRGRSFGRFQPWPVTK